MVRDEGGVKMVVEDLKLSMEEVMRACGGGGSGYGRGKDPRDTPT